MAASWRRCLTVDAGIPSDAVARVRDGVTWRHFDDRPFFAGEEEECVNGGVLAIAAYFGQLDEGTERLFIPQGEREDYEITGDVGDADGVNCEVSVER